MTSITVMVVIAVFILRSVVTVDVVTVGGIAIATVCGGGGGRDGDPLMAVVTVGGACCCCYFCHE